MTEHRLKSWPESFDPVHQGIKTFELRRNDRGYQPGDILILMEWEPPSGSVGEGRYTGRECRRRVSYVMHGMGSIGIVEARRGIDRNYCILGLMETTL